MLSKIQRELKAPKGQYNNFGKYKYRSCEDILEAVKPLLADCLILVSDEIIQIGERYYVKATATFKDANGAETVVSAFAREPLMKKGMDESQITGAASSYARKYALNGLLLIDDNKDADSAPAPQPAPKAPSSKEKLFGLISKYTKNYAEKEKLSALLEQLGVETSKELASKDEPTLKEMISHIEKLINGVAK